MGRAKKTEAVLPDDVRSDMLSRAKKRGTGRRQTEIPGTERVHDEELEAAAEDLRHIRDKRIALQVTEAAAAEALEDLFTARQQTEYFYEDDDGKKRRAYIVPGKNRVSVRAVKEPRAATAEAAE